MSLEAVLSAIRQSGQAQVDQIIDDARARVSTILDEARAEARERRQDAYDRASMPAYRERARMIHRARLEALRTLGDAREECIRDALAQARGHLSQLRTAAQYPLILRRLTEEALAELQGSLEVLRTVHLQIDPRDEALMSEILEELGLSLTVSSSLQCWGGLAACSEDGCLVVINTLERRLERAMPVLRRRLAALFEEGGELRPSSITETPAFAP